MSVYETDTIVVRIGVEAKLELAERAAANDRSLSGEVRHGLRRYLEDLERAADDEEEDV
jgi:hypothetical protein